MFWTSLILFSSIFTLAIWFVVSYASWGRRYPTDDSEDGGSGGNLPIVDLPPDSTLDFLCTDRPSGIPEKAVSKQK